MSRILSEKIVKDRPGFWVRQFESERTSGQDAFDIAFGIVLPILVLAADPVVFKGGFLGDEPILGRYQFFAYLVTAIEITVLLVWITLSQHLRAFSAPIGGILIGGAIFSFAVGVLILPFSLMGLIILIGAAGFTPFLTGFVYLRTGVRALKAQEKNDAFDYRFLMAGLAALLAITLPALVSIQLVRTVSSSVNDLLNGDAKQAEMAINRLKWLPFNSTVNLRELVIAYGRESNPEKKAVLKRYYKDLTGEDIDVRLQIMND
ncbi:MAG TPA: hypothetical protein VGQ39_10580 [Pyrinomonadaceae bacterium]|jgi:hypothetical protein|nr:hypothetical protein [Pyrinomonadaceae bacterium]